MSVETELGLDASSKQRGASDPTASVWVAASAGTGKTKVLTDRVLSLMLAGTPPHRILCITFTKAAAAEMSIRLAEVLGGWAAIPSHELDTRLADLLGRLPNEREQTLARQLFARILDTPGGMNIQTIHSFCQSILARFPLEAGVAPHFSVLDERDQQELMGAALEDVFAAARQREDLADALTVITGHVQELEFGELTQSLAAERTKLGRMFERHGSVANTIAALAAHLGLDFDETPKTVIDAACDDLAFDGLGLRVALSGLEKGSETDRKRAASIAEWLQAAPSLRQEMFDTYANLFLTGTQPTQPRKNLITKKAAATAPGAAEILENEAERLLTAVMRRRAAVIAEATGAMLTLGEALLNAYQRHKDLGSLLDYDDLITGVANLLERHGSTSWVLFKLDGGVDHILIDEAQDTSPEQWRIVRALTSEFFAGEGMRSDGRTMFAVGDVKQSIFSFQGADPAEFVANRNWFGEQVRGSGQLWRPISMEVSFRSTRAVLAAVDAVFSLDDAADGVALDGEMIVHQAWRQLDGGTVEVWPPLVPREEDEPVPWRPPIERLPGDTPEARLARLVAKRIKDMVSGDILLSANRPVRPGDIMVLVRRRGMFVEALIRQLKLENVPVAGVDRMLINEQIAVMDLIALGRLVLLPTDDLTLATVLKPLIGLDDEQLFDIAHGRDGSLWSALRSKAGDVSAFGVALGQLNAFMALADLVPPFEFYARVLGPMGGRRRLLARLGPDAEDPLAEFLGLTLVYERSHAPSLEGFLQWIATTAVEIKRDLEQGDRDAVRVMTVHGAKGLQAPIVFMPDTMQVPTKMSRLLWSEVRDGELLLWPPRRSDCESLAERARETEKFRQRQEYRRLLYVAMTRAEDRLIVCGWRGARIEADDCWYRLIRNGLIARADELDVGIREDPFLAASEDSDDSEIVYLSCPQERQPGRKEARTKKPTPPLPDWVDQPPPPEPQPPLPLVPSQPEDDDPPVLSPLGPSGSARFRRGRIIHRLLQSLPDLPSETRDASARSWLARPVHGLDEDEQDQIAREVLAVLDEASLAAIFGAGSQAEVPLTGNINGRVISGQVDRLVVEPDTVTVLDYKTHRPPPIEVVDVSPVYLRQMAAYRGALRAVYPGRRVRCVLLWTDGPRSMPLPDHLLDQYAP